MSTRRGPQREQPLNLLFAVLRTAGQVEVHAVLKCLRPGPGQLRQVVSVNDDVMEPDRHAVSMRGHAGLHPRTRPLHAETTVDTGLLDTWHHAE